MSAIPNIRRQLSRWSANELNAAALGGSLLSSLVTYVLAVIFVISFAALVFSEELAGLLPQVLGFILIGNAIMLAVVALLSSYPGSTAIAQDAPAAVLAVALASVGTAIPAASAEEQFATSMLMILTTTVTAGVVFLALGVFNLGGLVRFLPYPVMGGFLAGTGWLMVKGGVEIMSGVPLGAEWLDPTILLHWLPGAVLGVVILFSVARMPRPFTLPVVLAAGCVLFYIVAGALNVSPQQLESEGWVVGSIASGDLSRLPLSTNILSQVNWTMILGQAPSLASAIIISVVALLLNSGGLELEIKKDLDLNRELVAVGVGNIAAGAVGGLIGYHAISLSTLNNQMTGGKRLVGLIAALLVGATIFAGAPLLAYIPRMILGAVLVFSGVALLVEWVYEAWFRFPRIDFAIIVAILGLIMFSGYLNGIIVGLVMAIIMFVVSYSRVSPVRFAVSGREYHSRVTRAPQHDNILERHAGQLFILKLQGFIFFGTANNIVDQVRSRFDGGQDGRDGPVRFVLLDFGQASGLDSTGFLSFTRLLQWSQDRKVVLVLTGLNGRTKEQFLRAGFREEEGGLRLFSDLDHGIEWCENQIIMEASAGKPAEGELISVLRSILGDQEGAEKLLSHMHRREYAPGEYLIRQGDEPDNLYFIESGQVTAQLEGEGQNPLRLETMGAGRSVGELGFYLNIRRTATVTVDERSVIYTLSKQDLADVERLDPEAANLLHRVVVHLLGERVLHLTRTVNALER
ncbi:MAG: SLC26A/SulP transporter family protein [Chloroflexia bacterium]